MRNPAIPMTLYTVGHPEARVHLLDERRTRPHRLPDFARVEAQRILNDGGQMELL